MPHRKTADYWQGRAEECAIIAEACVTEIARKTLEECAQQYAQFADQEREHELQLSQLTRWSKIS